MTNLIQQMLSGDRLALSRLMSQVESRSSPAGYGDFISVMKEVQKKCGRAQTLGITGPPGAGKSTLVNQVISHFRKAGKTVGVVAVDPSSPFSGGAVLGDRIRMQEHSGDEGVFVRSLGSRGSHGGLSRATREVVKLYDAFGMDRVIVETVGVGQTELDVKGLVETTVLVLTPESGDAIQTLKAGILEIADILVVNKSDRDGALLMRKELQAMLTLGGSNVDWDVPVLTLQADKGVGIAELISAVTAHQKYLAGAGQKIQKERRQKILREEVLEIVLDEIRIRLSERIDPQVLDVSDNPYELAQRLLESQKI